MDFNDILKRGKQRMLITDVELLYKTAKEINAKNIVEIGSMDGCSSMTLGYVAKETGGHLYSVEPVPKASWKVNMQELNLEQYATLIWEASPWVNIKTIPMPIDYLLIDGDHRTRWCVVDYHFWEHYVRVGGRIAFHDWTARKGVAEWIKRAIDLILEDDKLIEVGRSEGSDRGMIVFEKPDPNKAV